ncbi:hypothetical protein J4423_00285 [Candidatus Pacearchaeota archaeon]|nr:hypothetical protein [Candidatus Pacearchaeota archaeon]
MGKVYLYLIVLLLITVPLVSAFYPLDWIKSFFETEEDSFTKIINPINNSMLNQGDEIDIAWDTSSFVIVEYSITVNLIRLDDEGNEVFGITLGRELKKRSLKWKVPEGLTGNFAIVVKTNGQGIHSSMDKVFITIKGEDKDPIIRSITPDRGSLRAVPNMANDLEIENKNQFSTITISGENFASNELGRNNIKLYPDSKENYDIYFTLIEGAPQTENQLNVRFIDGLITELDLEPGKYEVYIENIFGTSNKVPLYIEEPSTPKVKKIVFPEENSKLKIGSTYDIEWKSRNIETIDYITLIDQTPKCHQSTSIPTTSKPRGEESNSQNTGNSQNTEVTSEVCLTKGIILFKNVENTGSVKWTVPKIVKYENIDQMQIIPGNEYKIRIGDLESSSFKIID